MVRFATVDASPCITNPSEPFASMVTSEEPGPMIDSGPPAATACGSADASVMVPRPAPEKVTKSGAAVPLAVVIASRREPAPLSAVLVTV